jgi:hypothetical protein
MLLAFKAEKRLQDGEFWSRFNKTWEAERLVPPFLLAEFGGPECLIFQ